MEHGISENARSSPSASISRLKWLTLFRVGLVTVLLSATVVFNLQDDSKLNDRLYVYLYYLCTLVFVVSFAYTVALRLLRKDRHLQVLTWVQFSGDVLVAAALVLATGGANSVFTFFFSLVIIGGAIVLFRPGALYLATLSSALLLCIGLIEVGIIPGLHVLSNYRLALTPPPTWLSPLEQVDTFYHMVYSVSINVVAFYGVGILASWLSEQLRRSAQQLRSQRRSMDELRALLHDIVDSVATGIVTIDNDRRITFVNAAAEAITGLSPEAVKANDITDYFRDLRFVLENPHKKNTASREETIAVFGRKRVYLGWSLSPLRNADGELTGHVFMFQDITRVKEMERAIQRGKKLAAIGELSAAIAHEIRNPLAAISGSIQLLQANVDIHGDDRRLMDIVLRETEQLNQWINDFLDYSRPPPAERRPIDLTEIVREAVAMAGQSEAFHGVRLQARLEGAMPVLGDARNVRQVVRNLLNNAAEATTNGGTVKVELAPAGGSRPLIELLVADDGPGIPDADLERIFEPFFTTKERGTGLGLAVVHRIVEDHDGHIYVDSRIGEGTTFRIQLPMSVLPLSADEAPEWPPS